MTQHANMVKVTAAAPNTGSVTVSTAVSGFRTFATAFGSADAVVAGVRIEDASDATKWEIARDCAYTHSGTTLTRGTLESSSTGSVVDFTGSVIVSVIETAGFGNNAGLKHKAETVTTGNVTGVVGTLHLVDIDGMTAARDFVLPTAAATGDRIGVFCTTNAPTTAAYVLQIKSGAAGDLINGTDHSSTIWSALLIKGECLIFRCVDGSTVDWIVEYDGRIPCVMALSLSTVVTTGDTGGTYYAPTALGGAWTTNINVGECADSGASKFVCRRAGKYQFTGVASGYNNTGTDKYLTARVWDGTIIFGEVHNVPGLSTTLRNPFVFVGVMTVSQYAQYQFRNQDSAIGAGIATRFGVVELL